MHWFGICILVLLSFAVLAAFVGIIIDHLYPMPLVPPPRYIIDPNTDRIYMPTNSIPTVQPLTGEVTYTSVDSYSALQGLLREVYTPELINSVISRPYSFTYATPSVGSYVVYGGVGGSGTMTFMSSFEPYNTLPAPKKIKRNLPEWF